VRRNRFPCKRNLRAGGPIRSSIYNDTKKERKKMKLKIDKKYDYVEKEKTMIETNKWKDEYDSKNTNSISSKFKPSSGLAIDITNSHKDHPGEWVMHCSDILIDTHQLRIPSNSVMPNIDVAKDAAIEVIKNIIDKWKMELDEY